MADFYKIQQEKEKEDEVDYFDRLPDPIILLIFNKLLDAKSLCSCLLVSRNFASLVSQVYSISFNSRNFLKLRTGSNSTSSKSFLKCFVSKFMAKHFHFLHQFMGFKKINSSSSSSSSYLDISNWVVAALKNFIQIKSLELELPFHGGEIGVNKTIPLLKWEAGFGKDLESCVILGATSISKREKVVDFGDQNEPSSFSDDELKLRIIWIISSLIASSARHNLLKKVVKDYPNLSKVVISDAVKQGKLCMNAGQIRYLKDSMSMVMMTNSNTTTNTNPSEPPPQPQPEASATTSATTVAAAASAMGGYVGNLVMKLWYVKELALPGSGCVLEGATLVVIRPDGKVGDDEVVEREREGGDIMSLKGAFEGDEVFAEAAMELLKRKGNKVYRLEMNSI